ncbi:hypothetical protein [Enterococcus avium]|uniref:hypothetical protein n=1 Tax=Enterococcus avium TaxID=33945 RepID=UPI00379840E5
MAAEAEKFASELFVSLDVTKENLQELYQDIGNELVEKGMVMSDYGEQLQQREANFQRD